MHDDIKTLYNFFRQLEGGHSPDKKNGKCTRRCGWLVGSCKSMGCREWNGETKTTKGVAHVMICLWTSNTFVYTFRSPVEVPSELTWGRGHSIAYADVYRIT